MSRDVEGLLAGLSKPQREALADIAASEYGVTFADNYPPIKKLLAASLVTRHEGKYTETYRLAENLDRAALLRALAPSSSESET